MSEIMRRSIRVSARAVSSSLSLLLAVLVAGAGLGAQEQPKAPDAWARLALTPPMGWNSWNKFACDVNEQLIREMADTMVTSGMKDAGYVYLVIDDGWQIDRDVQGNILPDPQRFPSGMKALVDYVHSKGLKFGL